MHQLWLTPSLRQNQCQKVLIEQKRKTPVFRQRSPGPGLEAQRGGIYVWKTLSD